MNLDTPEGRLAAAESLGPDGYNAAMEAHHKASEIATVNGYGIRPVSSRFGRLFMVVGTDAAFSTQAAAEAHAKSLPRHRAAPDRSYSTVSLSEREENFIIAAIRLWQSIQVGHYALVDSKGNPAGVDNFEDIATSFYSHPALDAVEIDDMACEVFALDPWLTEEERAALD